MCLHISLGWEPVYLALVTASPGGITGSQSASDWQYLVPHPCEEEGEGGRGEEEERKRERVSVCCPPRAGQHGKQTHLGVMGDVELPGAGGQRPSAGRCRGKSPPGGMWASGTIQVKRNGSELLLFFMFGSHSAQRGLTPFLGLWIHGLAADLFTYFPSSFISPPTSLLPQRLPLRCILNVFLNKYAFWIDMKC